jgi:hypothetical protein
MQGRYKLGQQTGLLREGRAGRTTGEDAAVDLEAREPYLAAQLGAPPAPNGAPDEHARERGGGPSIVLSPARITAALGLMALTLIVTHLIVMALYHFYWSSGEYGWTAGQYRHFATLFNLNEEANPAAWYASFTLLVSSVLLGIIAFDKCAQRDRYAWHWAVLALVFLYLSIDEGSRLHERAILPLRAALNLGGLFFYSWVLLGIPAVLLFGLAYLRFVLHLPRSIRLLFFIAAITYVSGALGVEMIEGFYDELQGGLGETDMLFALFVALEEGAEMLGVLVFIHALMSYVRSYVGAVRLRFGGSVS